MNKEQVVALVCKKHVKIYKLKQLGLKNKEIAEALGTNVGHVYNALKKYEGNEKLINDANNVMVDVF